MASFNTPFEGPLPNGESLFKNLVPYRPHRSKKKKKKKTNLVYTPHPILFLFFVSLICASSNIIGRDPLRGHGFILMLADVFFLIKIIKVKYKHSEIMSKNLSHMLPHKLREEFVQNFQS